MTMYENSRTPALSWRHAMRNERLEAGTAMMTEPTPTLTPLDRPDLYASGIWPIAGHQTPARPCCPWVENAECRRE